jgi:hypothetical protein
MRTLCSWGFIVSGALCAVAVFAQSQTSTWEHSGSTVYLSANGVKRQFYYQNPRPGMQQEGVRPGTLLFDGRRTRNQYSGTAYIFSRRCGAVPYSVSGAVSPDDRTVTLYGNAPSGFNAHCQVIGYTPDVLVFNLTTLPETNIGIESTNKKWICLHPVFTEEMRLKCALDGTPARTDYVTKAIIYLRSKYCRMFDGEVTADQTEHVGENCYENSGSFRGERVYWGQCYE